MFKPLEIVLSSTLTINSWSLPPEPPVEIILDKDYSLEAYKCLKDRYPKTEEEKLMDLIYGSIFRDQNP